MITFAFPALEPLEDLGPHQTRERATDDDSFDLGAVFLRIVTEGVEGAGGTPRVWGEVAVREAMVTPEDSRPGAPGTPGTPGTLSTLSPVKTPHDVDARPGALSVPSVPEPPRILSPLSTPGPLRAPIPVHAPGVSDTGSAEDPSSVPHDADASPGTLSSPSAPSAPSAPKALGAVSTLSTLSPVVTPREPDVDARPSRLSTLSASAPAQPEEPSSVPHHADVRPGTLSTPGAPGAPGAPSAPRAPRTPSALNTPSTLANSADGAPSVTHHADRPSTLSAPSTPSTLSAPSTLSTPSTLNTLSSRLVEVMTWQRREGGGQAEVQLHPEYLGAVTVSVQVQRGVVRAVIRAESTQALDRLAAEMGSLQEALAERGLTLDHLELKEDPALAARHAREGGRDAGREDAREQSREPEARPRRRWADGAQRFEDVFERTVVHG